MSMTVFIWGALAMASLVAGLFFLKFWSRTRDPLFGLFGAAFFVFALNWSLLGTTHPTEESGHYAYMVRLGAYVLILLGIVIKNRK
jgi:hypothetical protein